jgi:hypothetical protein
MRLSEFGPQDKLELEAVLAGPEEARQDGRDWTRPASLVGSDLDQENSVRLNLLRSSTFVVLALSAALGSAQAQQPAATAPPIEQGQGDGTMLMMVIMKHDQSKNLNEINETIRKNGYFEQFPPAGVEVVSMYVVMGVGQFMVLKMKPEKVREVNVILENTVWGPYRTEFYPAYDYKDLAAKQREMVRAKGRQ